jgi:hypothetical protein
MVKKILGWLALAMVVLYALKNPTGAAGTFRHLGTTLASLGDGAGRFLSALIGGGHR